MKCLLISIIPYSRPDTPVCLIVDVTTSYFSNEVLKYTLRITSSDSFDQSTNFLAAA